jgi:hypothetical protein
MRVRALALMVALGGAPAVCGQTFVNWESPHVSPLDLTPDGWRAMAVNTANNRIEIFTVTADGLGHAGSVPVGLNPVSVRTRTDTEAWIVNHGSDTVSVVSLNAMNVVATLYPGDEPGWELTFTSVPAGTEQRIGVDRDEDGACDRDEADAGQRPGGSGQHAARHPPRRRGRRRHGRPRRPPGAPAALERLARTIHEAPPPAGDPSPWARRRASTYRGNMPSARRRAREAGLPRWFAMCPIRHALRISASRTQAATCQTHDGAS